MSSTIVVPPLSPTPPSRVTFAAAYGGEMSAGTRRDPLGQSLATIRPASSTACAEVHLPGSIVGPAQAPPTLRQWAPPLDVAPPARAPAPPPPCSGVPVPPIRFGPAHPPLPL